MFLLRVIILVCLGTVARNAAAIPRLDLPEDGLRYDQMAAFEYLTPSDDASFAQVAARPDWLVSQTAIPPLSSVDHSLWIRYTLINRAQKSRWALVGYRDPNMNRNDFYLQYSDGKTLHASFPSQGEDQLSWYDLIPGTLFELKPGETVTVYLRQQGHLTPSNRFHVMDEVKYKSLSWTAHLFYGTYLGSGMLAFMLSILFFLAFRDRFYFAYAMYTCTFLVLAVVNPGIWNAYFPTPRLGDMLQKIAEVLPVFPGIYMAQLFLTTKREMPRAHRALNVLSISTLIFMVARLTLLVEGLADQILLNACHALILSLITYACWHRSLKKEPGVRLFMLSWLTLALTVVIWGFAMIGWLPAVFWLVYAPFWGQMLQFNVLTLVTINRIIRLQKVDVEAKMEKLRHDDLRMLLRVICHDLLNPISVISGMAQINLARRKDPDATQAMKDWSKVLFQVNHQVEIIEHIKTMQTLHDQKLEIKLSSVSLPAACREVAALLDDKIRQKNVSIDLHFEGTNDIVILAERTGLIHQVLANIVSNAIKFSMPGEKIVIKGGEMESCIWLDIIDQGTGMPDDILKNLFSPSIPTTRTGTGGEKGTGYGMPLVKAYMDHFHGNILVESRNVESYPQDHGTRVRLTFKQASSDAFESLNARVKCA